MTIIDFEKLPCSTNVDIFWSPEDDGRVEIGRKEREALAGTLCRSECPIWLQCLERSLVRNEPYGVWGGMAEGERREFRKHLIEEGYGKREVPDGPELRAAVNSFYRYQPTPDERYFDAVPA